MSNGKHLLVSVRAQALVIDDIVVRRKATLLENEQGRVADDGKWSRAVRDYMPLLNFLGAPDPQPFYGASRTAGGEPAASQLVLPSNSKALPRDQDRGVYLHWVLPPGLRHAYRPNSLDFPALPDQWLIVRFCRRGAEEQATTRAWFLDGGLVVGSGSPANLLDADGAEYVARRVGKVVPVEEFRPEDFAGRRTTITAVGNRYTGSPTFTANVAENRNILSWHDGLEDLRGAGKIPKDTALTYLLLGWYRDARDEPFAALPAQLKKEDSTGEPGAPDVLEALGWKLDAAPPSDLSAHRCLFHGMVAHVNYWNPNTYKGTILGYPGAPPVEGTLSSAPPAFTVGVGNSAEDALVSLVSSEYTELNGKPDLWKALEAVIYRKPESLVGSWNAAPLGHTVHQNWFNTQEAGKVWTIRPRPRAEEFDAFPAATAGQTEVNSTPDQLAAAAAQLEVKPTPDQLAAVKKLNELQAGADAVGRELSALQQDLYARWWKMCAETRASARPEVEDEETDCAALAERINTLRGDRDKLLGELRTQQALAAKLPDELELHSDPAPRFWTPADPFVVIKNCGAPTKHHFPRPLPCRLTGQTVNAAEVIVNREPKRFDAAAGVTQLADSVRKHFAPRDEILTRLIGEASIVEQAVSDLVARSLLKESPLSDEGKWRTWTERLVEDFTRGGESTDLRLNRIRFGAANAPDVSPSMLAELWVRQPWSPLFIDWKISWRPTKTDGADFRPVWSLGQYDYEPKSRETIPRAGATLTGRSMLSPVDGRLFAKPLELLREMIAPPSADDRERGLNPAFHPAAAEILRNYNVIWDTELAKLESAGMMGQVLSGFHQALLGRDVTLPRVLPDPARPWAPDAPSYQDAEVKALLDAPVEDGPAGEQLAPPSHVKPKLDFSLLREGAFQLEELWLVDDFGQWADLLHGTSAGGSAGQVFNPRARWDNDRFVVAMPPRVVQPTRLNFRFVETADEGPAAGKADPALDPVCGWIFYNPLDRALALCDRRGRFKGELVVVEEERNLYLVKWEPAPGGGRPDSLPNHVLRDFAAALEEPEPTERPRLRELLALIERALERIRPAAGRREAGLFGRPLALVSAQVGLELFGKAWTDPHWTDPRKRPSATRPAGTGDPSLDALRAPVVLGCRHNTEDGLVGYFKANDFKRIVPAQLPEDFKPSEYLARPGEDAVRVGFGAPEPLTLLLDAWGSVQAAVGILPAKSITLAHAELDKTLARMEASFRVGPVLLQPDRVALPTPVGDKGRWHFRGPSADDATTPVAPPDPRRLAEQPPVAAEGRLLLLTSEE